MPQKTNARFKKAAFPFFLLSTLENFAPIYPLYLVMFSARGMDYGALSLLIVI